MRAAEAWACSEGFIKHVQPAAIAPISGKIVSTHGKFQGLKVGCLHGAKTTWAGVNDLPDVNHCTLGRLEYCCVPSTTPSLYLRFLGRTPSFEILGSMKGT